MSDDRPKKIVYTATLAAEFVKLPTFEVISDLSPNGSQMMRNLTRREIVDRAVSLAEMLAQEFEDRGWIVDA